MLYNIESEVVSFMTPFSAAVYLTLNYLEWQWVLQLIYPVFAVLEIDD